MRGLLLVTVVAACAVPDGTQATSRSKPEAPAAASPGAAEPHPEMVEVRPSLCPTAGMGLFARVDIPAGTYIGPYTGTFLTREQVMALEDETAQYLFQVPDCANKPEYDAILGDMDHYVSKTNYAPKFINGYATRLQNTDFLIFCEAPYARLHTTRAVKAGEELYTDYGEDYDYFFMEVPEVRAYLLKAAGIDAPTILSWDYSQPQ